MTELSPAVTLKNVSMSYGYNGHRLPVLHSVSMEAMPGEVVLLLGPSGSGKTTLLSLIAGLLPPVSGTVELFGSETQKKTVRELQELRAKSIGFVFQNFLLLDGLTVAENVRIVLEFAGWSKSTAKERVALLLERFGTTHLADRAPHGLSQGERQRVAIARAMAAGPRLILADEPTASLDSVRGQEIIELLREMARTEGCTVIVASHDLRLQQFADRILRIEDGTIRSDEVN